MSGPAGEKSPQTNADVLDLSLSYRMVSEVVASEEYDYWWTNSTTAVLPIDRTNHRAFWRAQGYTQTNLHDVRLVFRWPLLPNGSTGPGRMVFHTLAGGVMRATNEFSTNNDSSYRYCNLYFLDPRTYSCFQTQ
jgi:hypothetical protein